MSSFVRNPSPLGGWVPRLLLSALLITPPSAEARRTQKQPKQTCPWQDTTVQLISMKGRHVRIGDTTWDLSDAAAKKDLAGKLVACGVSGGGKAMNEWQSIRGAWFFAIVPGAVLVFPVALSPILAVHQGKAKKAARSKAMSGPVLSATKKTARTIERSRALPTPEAVAMLQETADEWDSLVLYAELATRLGQVDGYAQKQHEAWVRARSIAQAQGHTRANEALEASVALARESWAREDWKRARRTDTRAAYLAFLDQHPNAVEAMLAKQRLSTLDEAAHYARAAATDTTEAWVAFVQKWPTQAHAEDAEQALVRSLSATETAQGANRYLELRAADNTPAAHPHLAAAYALSLSVVPTSVGPLTSWLQAHPTAPNATAAETRLVAAAAPQRTEAQLVKLARDTADWRPALSAALWSDVHAEHYGDGASVAATLRFAKRYPEAPRSDTLRASAQKKWKGAFSVGTVDFQQHSENGGTQTGYSLIASAANDKHTEVERQVVLYDPLVYVSGSVHNASDLAGTAEVKLKVALCPGFEGGSFGSLLGKLISRAEGTTSGGATSVYRTVRVKVPAKSTQKFRHTIDLQESAVCSPEVEWVKGSVASVSER